MHMAIASALSMFDNKLAPFWNEGKVLEQERGHKGFSSPISSRARVSTVGQTTPLTMSDTVEAVIPQRAATSVIDRSTGSPRISRISSPSAALPLCSGPTTGRSSSAKRWPTGHPTR